MADGHTIISRKDAQVSGLKRYFTGIPCFAGHVAERYVSNRMCSLCQLVKKDKWAIENPEKVHAYNLRHYAENREVARERSRKWSRNNPDQVRANKKIDYSRHRSARLVTMAIYRSKNRDRLRLSEKAKVAKAPERYAAYKRNRKARVRNAPGSHTSDDVASIKNMQRHRCACCRVKLTSKYHVDHVVPIARGGENGRRNLQILCASCNQSKSAKDPIEFMRERGRLL